MAESLSNHIADEDDLMPHQMLSDREFQTARVIASGQTPTEIAQILSISPKTVSVYRSRVFDKMGMRTNAQLTQYVITHGLLD